MKKITLITFIILSMSFAKAQEITGKWSGKLNIQGTELRIVFNIEKSDSGYTTTMDSPDQGVNGIPTNSTEFTTPKLKIEAKAMRMIFEGTQISENELKGTLTQGGSGKAISLTRSTGEVENIRPQEPVAPFPYSSENVKFTNTVENVTLAGTITYPLGAGPFPAVVLVSGSGPQNRNEELLGHKPFLVLADYLTKKGIAVLRYDDRGTAESKGNFATGTSENFANDAEAAFEYLRIQSNIQKDKTGILGHSEGGLIAAIIAARNKDVAFIGLLAGTGVAGSPLILEQTRLIQKADGFTDEQNEAAYAIGKGAHDIIYKEKDGDSLKIKLREYYSNLWAAATDADFPQGMTKEQILQVQIGQLSNPWFVNFLTYDPATALKKVTCPVLAINGEKDLQVDANQNLPAIEAALKYAGNKDVTFKRIPGLNHLFQEAETGLPKEYGTIKQTYSPLALDIIGNWVIMQTK